MYAWRQYSAPRGAITSTREKILTVGIFKKNTSKYAKLIVEPYICNYLNQIYRIFYFKQKNFEIHLDLENRMNRISPFLSPWKNFRISVNFAKCFTKMLWSTWGQLNRIITIIYRNYLIYYQSGYHWITLFIQKE